MMSHAIDRYEERLKYIQAITTNQLHSSFEDYCENVMHPMEMSASQAVPTGRDSISRSSPCKHPTPDTSLTSLLRLSALSSGHLSPPSLHHHHHHQQQSTPTIGGAFLKLDHTSPRRQRANTDDDRMTRSSEHSDQCELMVIPVPNTDITFCIIAAHILLRNSSVPDSLNDLSSSGRFGSSPSPSSRRGLLYSVSPSQSNTS